MLEEAFQTGPENRQGDYLRERLICKSSEVERLRVAAGTLQCFEGLLVSHILEPQILKEPEEAFQRFGSDEVERMEED